MPNPLQQTIEALAKEKGIEPDVVITAIEEAVATASRKYYKTGENLKTRFNTETGQVDLFALKTVVEDVTTPATEISLTEAREMYRPLYGDEVANSIELGDEMEFPKPTEVLGRIAAQTAKQVIFQKVREAERENIFAEYNQRIGEVINGTVKRFENGDIIIEVGRIEAVLPRKEQSRAESYAPQDVPEIYDGTVMIRGAVREAGDRAKVAVFSRERDVDPVGACVGMKGTRVQSIIRELRGEKIDIVEWSDDPIAFVTNALSPAKVQRVSIVDDGERVMEVIVEDKQLSLAIGKKGQNVRLGAKLTGWRIDIKSEEEKRREVEAQFEGLETASEASESAETSGSVETSESAETPESVETSESAETPESSESAGSIESTDTTEAVPTETEETATPYALAGVGEKTVRKLVDAGFATREAVAAATVEEISQLPGIGEKTAERILAAARGEEATGSADL